MTAAGELACFSLASHDGPYPQWPLKSRLLRDGAPTPARLPGYALRHQFELAAGYLLVTDWDCPFEEATHFTLLSRDLRVLACRSLGAPYSSWLLTGFRRVDHCRFVASFGAAEEWAVTVRPWSVPLLRRRIVLQRIGDRMTFSDNPAV